MYARVMIGQVKPEQTDKMDNAIRVYGESILPEARQQQGFTNAFLLTNPRTGKAMSITFWETEDDMRESEASAYYQEQIARIASFMAGPGVVDHYQLSAWGTSDVAVDKA